MRLKRRPARNHLIARAKGIGQRTARRADGACSRGMLAGRRLVATSSRCPLAIEAAAKARNPRAAFSRSLQYVRVSGDRISRPSADVSTVLKFVKADR